MSPTTHQTLRWLRRLLWAVGRSHRNVDDQLQCPLLTKLPMEVRMKIYQLIIDGWGWGNKIEIATPMADTLRFNRHFNPEPEPKPPLIYLPRSIASTYKSSEVDYYDFYDELERNKKAARDYRLAPLLACRQMHNEAIDVLYSSYTFHLHDLIASNYFLTVIRPENLNRISSLQLRWIILDPETRYNSDIGKVTGEEAWLRICSILRSMKGLRELVIRIYLGHYYRMYEQKVLEPLMAIESPRGRFLVEIPWSHEHSPIFETADENVAPFKVVRRSSSEEAKTYLYTVGGGPKRSKLSWIWRRMNAKWRRRQDSDGEASEQDSDGETSD